MSVPVVAVLSHAVIDEVRVPGRSDAVVAVGGAGSYAAVGASLGSRESRAMIVSGVGADDRDRLSTWFREREVDPGGLFEVGTSSPRTVVQYDVSGERVETSTHGADHFDSHTPLPRHIPDDVAVAAAYLFHDTEHAYWDAVEEFRRSFSGPILWEMSAAAASPQHLGEVARAVALVDVLSVNRSEAMALFGVRTVPAAVAELRRLGGTTLLRLGAHGSILVDARAGTLAIPAAPAAVVDPTGGGNSYSGAYLASWAETGDAHRAGRVAALVAAEVIGRFGAPVVDAALRSRIAARADGSTVGQPMPHHLTSTQERHDA